MHRSRHRSRVWLGALLAAAWLAFSAIPVQAGDYDPQQAGHPLRVIAYVLHPVGVALDYLIFRPAYWLGSKEPLRTIFGVEEGLPDDEPDLQVSKAPGSTSPDQGSSSSPQGQKN